MADQDYANLKSLFLIVGDPGDVPDRVRQRVPNAFVRAVGNTSGYGAAANEVLRLVEGENGFFCFLHDDVALDPSAIRLLVEESTARTPGSSGRSWSAWDDPGVLQHVGLGVDRFGEIDSFVEEGEVDQEQHDAVRDVFALPSACLMVRADLFRAIAGFDRRSTSTATTSTCAGEPTSAAPGSWSCPWLEPATARRCRNVGPICARPCCRPVTGCARSRRSPAPAGCRC